MTDPMQILVKLDFFFYSISNQDSIGKTNELRS
jgi:hypothetical protein